VLSGLAHNRTARTSTACAGITQTLPSSSEARKPACKHLMEVRYPVSQDIFKLN
jgi:hypothetical protein